MRQVRFDPATLPSAPIITVNAYRSVCRWILDEFGARENTSVQNAGYHFVKTDFLGDFRRPDSPYVLITGNSDDAIPGAAHRHLLNDPLLVAWFGVNVSIEHEKLHPLPLGLTNRPHVARDSGYGQATAYDFVHRISETVPVKDKIVNATYAVATNRRDREECRRCTGVPIYGATPEKLRLGLSGQVSHDDYMVELSRALFTISPEGNGIDCHRHWEALYARTIPIVTSSPTTRALSRRYPMLVLGAWSDYRADDLTQGRYDDIWGDFDVCDLYVDRVIARLWELD